MVIQLDNPRGIALGGAGEIYIADSGDPSEAFPGRVLRISSTGEVEPYLAPFSGFVYDTASETYVFGLSDVATAANSLYVLLGLGAFLRSPIYAENHLISITPDRDISDLFSTAAYESEHDPDGAGVDSNATGVAIGSEGTLWITDAAGNWAGHLIPTSTGDGTLEVGAVAVFPAVNGEDAVPTGIATGPDGNAYVALFRCQQPTAGKGGIARVLPDGSYEIVATDLSNPIDVAFDATGRMYVIEFAVDYAPETGRMLRVEPDGQVDVILHDLTFPTSLAISDDGDVYITEIASPAGGPAGSGRLLIYESLIVNAAN